MQPIFKILHEDEDLTKIFKDRLLSLRVTDMAGVTSDQFDLAIDNRDEAVQIPETGATLSIFMGYEPGQILDMGKYTVDELEASGLPRSLVLRGKAADMATSFKSQKQRSWDKTTLGEIIATIAKDNGLQAKIADKYKPIESNHLDQAYESDLNVITRLADQYGALTKPAGGFLLFVEQTAGTDADGKPFPTIDIYPTDISSSGGWRTSLHDRQNYACVAAHWGDKRAAKTQYVYAGQGEPVMHIKNPYQSEADALAAAESKLRSLQRGRTDLSLSLVGKPELCAEMPIYLSGFDGLANGEWIVVRAEHTIDNSGYTTRIEAQRRDDITAASAEKLESNQQKKDKAKKARKPQTKPGPLPEHGDWEKWDNM